jgi:Matrixin
MRTLKLIFISLLSTSILFSIGYLVNPNIKKIIDRKIELLLPCKLPISYSIVGLDNDFGITRSDFLNDIQTAENVWEKESNLNLYEYKETGGTISINLIYDQRQASTLKLKTLNTVIDSDKANFEKLNTKYTELKNVFERSKSVYEQKVAAIKKEKEYLDSQVSYWNAKGGAPKNIYNELLKSESELKNKLTKLESEENALQIKAAEINTLGNSLNGFVKGLNQNVDTFNTTRVANGQEFDEGEYVENKDERAINIYQYDNKAKLIRVLAHELGHSLGIDHNDNPSSLMYKLNQGNALDLSVEDVKSLKGVCRIK